jgi:multimeric flavodoxin WrbA
MKITILNGNPHPDYTTFDNYLKNLVKSLEDSKNNVTHFKLREMNLRHCRGCFGCWLKTPGQCIYKDDTHNICREVINSDFVLFGSPLIMGFPSAILKTAMDKLIPLLHPYFDLVDNKECHHKKRYDKKYPFIGLLIEKEEDTDEEDVKIITDIFDRFAIDMRTSSSFVRDTKIPVKEVLDEINRV